MNRRKLLFAALVIATSIIPGPAKAHILDLTTGDYVSLAAMIDDLESVQVVFVGELHDAVPHHQAQLQVIRELIDRGDKIAIGLEMFRADAQQVLDDWSNGYLEEGVFKVIFERNWDMWPVYRPIFEYARKNKIPLVGLNIDRNITRQVSTNGFASLSPAELEELEGVSCDVDQHYQNFIRKALTRHFATPEKFVFFCEAQLVWDTMMAQNLLAWHRQHPEETVVVLAGNGHAWRYGIPEQLRRRAALSYRILLPEVPGRQDRSNTTGAEGDYLLLGLGQGKLH